MTLRDYQRAAVEHTLAAFADGKRVIIAMPTGAGKTETASAILSQFSEPCAVVHTTVLAEQSKRRLAHIPRLRVVTLQSLLPGPNLASRLRELSDVDCVWYDEAHHIAAEEWGAISKHFAGKRVLGTSATPTTLLGHQFDVMVSPVGYRRLISDGHLVPCDVLVPEAVGDDERPDSLGCYLEHGRREDGSIRPGIYTASTVAACREASERLERAGLRTAVVTGLSGRGEREAAFHAYSKGALDVLCSPMVLAEGFDSPRAEVLIADRGFAELITFLQYAGRVLRPCPGKSRAPLIDSSGACARHGMPTDERVYSLRGGTESEAKVIEQAEKEDALKRERERKSSAAEVRFRLIRDTLAERALALVEQARERGYKVTWAGYKLKDTTGVHVTLVEAKWKSVCKVCRHRVAVGEPIVWNGPSNVSHLDCHLQQIDVSALEGAGRKLKL